MKIVGILIILVSLPAFVIMLGMGARYRNYAFFALGALPILSSGLNIDAAFYDIAGWPGHTKGIIVSLTDTLALAIALHYWKVRTSPLFLAVWLIYIALHLPGVFVAGYSTASLSYVYNLGRGLVYFMACYAVLKQGGIQPLILGLAVSVIANGAFTIRNAVSGQTQAGGMLGHRNYTGLVTNLAVPILLGAVLTWKKARVPVVALAFAAVSAALGGSRAAVVLFGVSVALTLFLALLVGQNRRVITVTAIAALGALVMAPAAAYKMQQRFDETGGSFTFEEDGERLAFKRASAMMNADYPLGIGLNQYAVKSNAGGYAEKAGVGWSTIGRTALVHNSYVLIRTEGGHAALLGVFIMLGSLISASLFLLIKNRSREIRIYAASVFVSISVLSLHINYEWSLVGIHVIYALGFCSALAGLMLKAPQTNRRRSSASPIMVSTKRRPKSL